MVVAQHISTSSAFLCIAKDFISTFLISVFIVYILHPLYKFLLKHTGIKIISAFASLAVAAAANIFSVLWIGMHLLSEATRLERSGTLRLLVTSGLSYHQPS